MMYRTRMTALLLLAAVGAGLAAPTAALASSEGRRNTAYALGAAGIYGLVKGKTALAALGIGGAVYSYMRSREAARRERARRLARSRYLASRYRRAPVRRVYRPASYRTRRYAPARARSAAPPGWSRGRKVGWNGRCVPPGHARKG